jgi:hypothetical protein
MQKERRKTVISGNSAGTPYAIVTAERAEERTVEKGGDGS